MQIATPRLLLRDFTLKDQEGFLAYQADPRYRALYDIAPGDESQGRDIFARCMAWQEESPRRNFQLGIFEKASGHLCGCAGVRIREDDPTAADVGIELNPADWGRYRLAMEVIAALADFAFETLRLERVVGSTASGNTKVEKLARWFGARLGESRDGPDWMSARGWREIDWTISREDWLSR